MTKSILSEQREADEALCEALEGLARDCRLSYGWEDTAPDCERAIARIRALSEALQEACHERDGLLVPEWQPIETAPRDGTAVYVCDTVSFEPLPVIAHWGQHDSWDDEPHWLVGRKEEWPRGRIKREPAIMPTPTHWQPLPTPPGEK